MSKSISRRPPISLGVAAVAAAWGALYSIALWFISFVLDPVHEDVRMIYVAAEAGVRYGWASIYDKGTLRTLSMAFPPGERHIDNVLTYVHPPLVAWLFAPLTIFSEPVAYGIWALVLLVALVAAWYLAAPFTGLAKLTLLLAAVSLWPVLLIFYFGQPITIVLALLALSWWLNERKQPVAAGACLALATFLKPQDLLLVPAALLVSGRYRVVTGWLGACAVLAAVSAFVLSPAGVFSWIEALRAGQASSTHQVYTLAKAIGLGPQTYALWALQGAAALLVARWRRQESGIVFAVGILGSTTVAFHFHEADYSGLVLAAWLVLRTAPPVWQRAWLLVGFTTMQWMTITTGAPVPQLVWDALWLAVLGSGSFRERLSQMRPVSLSIPRMLMKKAAKTV
jgi:hypothetical protein